MVPQLPDPIRPKSSTWEALYLPVYIRSPPVYHTLYLKSDGIAWSGQLDGVAVVNTEMVPEPSDPILYKQWIQMAPLTNVRKVEAPVQVILPL